MSTENFVGDNRVITKDKDSDALLNTFLGKLDWENPKYPNLFIKKAIDFSTTTDNIKPYIIGDFIKDTFLDEAIENSDSKVGFDNSIDSSVMHIKG